MISFIGEWIKHIILLILMATFLDLLLPNSSMRRYVKLVVGLLLILVILSPVLHIFQFDYERLLNTQEELFLEGDPVFLKKIEESQQSIEELQEKAILEEVAIAWSNQVKEQIESEFDLEVHDVQFTLLNQGEQVDVQELILFVEPRVENGDREDQTEIKKNVDSVKPIVIQVNSNVKENEETKNVSNKEKKIEKQILTYLAEEWNISVDKITCTWMRR